MGRGRRLVQLLSRTIDSWSEDNAYRLSAALAYYAVFAIAPVLIIAIAVAGAVFGRAAARGQVIQELSGLIGSAAAAAVSDLLTSARSSGLFNAASIAGFATIFIGATGVFVALQDGLNTIWRVKAKSKNVIYVFVRQRMYTFFLVLGIGVLLFGSLIASTALATLGELYGAKHGPAWFWQVVTGFASFFVVFLLFGLIFKLVPDVYVRWHDAFAGAVLAAVLFTAGKTGIGYYLGHSGFTSIYGAAGALVLVLAWVYYSSLILFFGAEFTATYARECGRAVVPKPNAVLMTAEDSVEQGLEPRRNPSLGDRNPPATPS